MFDTAFPAELWEELDAVLKILPGEPFSGIRTAISEESISYALDSGTVELPYRVYLPEPSEPECAALTPIRKQLLCCIYTRSSSGFLREKYLRRLLEQPLPPWAIPYIIKLCDEYVLEILQVLYTQLKDRDNTDLQRFCLQNKDLIRRGYSRMASYWDAYYRDQEYRFHNYTGQKLFSECLGYTRAFEK